MSNADTHCTGGREKGGPDGSRERICLIFPVLPLKSNNFISLCLTLLFLELLHCLSPSVKKKCDRNEYPCFKSFLVSFYLLALLSGIILAFWKKVC